MCGDAEEERPCIINNFTLSRDTESYRVAEFYSAKGIVALYWRGRLTDIVLNRTIHANHDSA